MSFHSKYRLQDQNLTKTARKRMQLPAIPAPAYLTVESHDWALWTAGVIVSLLTGGGVGIRLLLSPDWHSFAAWFAGACFIPSFALACGVWSGSGKMFEAIYTVWWYIGPAHQTPGIDFMGVSSASSTPGIYAVATFT